MKLSEGQISQLSITLQVQYDYLHVLDDLLASGSLVFCGNEEETFQFNQSRLIVKEHLEKGLISLSPKSQFIPQSLLSGNIALN